jgi:hypothetical protein
MYEQNMTQVGGTHYKKGGEEHWDRAYRLGYDCYQYIITKWLERWRDKGGLQDLYKARHALDKYIEVAEHEEKLRAEQPVPTPSLRSNPMSGFPEPGTDASRGYIGQDRRG